LLGILAAVGTEALIQWLRKVPIRVSDGSAVLTGMLLTYNISPSSPWWLPVVGAVFAIAIGKQIFGGLGNNPVNPALLGRAFLLASWPALMTGIQTWKQPGTAISMSGIDPRIIDPNLQAVSGKAYELVTGATPLNLAQTLRDSTFVNSLAATRDASLDLSNRIFNGMLDLGTLKNLFWGQSFGVRAAAGRRLSALAQDHRVAHPLLLPADGVCAHFPVRRVARNWLFAYPADLSPFLRRTAAGRFLHGDGLHHQPNNQKRQGRLCHRLRLAHCDNPFGGWIS